MYFDGASKGNPGPSGAAYWVQVKNEDGSDTFYEEYKFLGVQTNNVAEYSGLILGLKSLDKYKDSSIKIHGDSKLVIEQMSGKWKVNAENLKPLWIEARNLIKGFKDIQFIHIARNLNSKADSLANIAVVECS